MSGSFQPRAGARPRGTPAKSSALPRDVVEEVRRTTRPVAERDTLSRLARAVELLERGDPKGAVAEAEKAKQLSTRSASVREVLGLGLYGVGRWQEAASELKTYRRMTGRADQNHLIADCMRGLGKPNEAVPLADEALRDRAVPEEARVEAAIVGASALADLGRFAEALALIGRAKTRDEVAGESTLRLWYVKADVLEKAGRRDEAADHLRKIIRHDPAAFDAIERLAQLS